MVVNNDRNQTIEYFLEKEMNDGLIPPEPLDLANNLFKNDNRLLKMLVDGNSARILTIVCNRLVSKRDSDY